MSSYRNLRNLGFGVAAAIPLSLAASHQAHAIPYAYASNVDSGFTITSVLGGTYTALQNTAVFTTSNAITSSYFATPPSTLVSTTGNTISDAAQVQVPGGVAENFFGQAYKAAAVNSLRADSLDGAFSGGGGNVAETRLVTGPTGASTSGFGKLNSTNTSTIGVSVGAGTVLQVTFNVTPGLEASTSALIGESATATIASSVSITRLDGTTVFSFVPTGNLLGDVTGGTAVSDPFSLNRTISSTSGTPADNTFFPGSGTFTANTGPLSAGFYNIVIGQSSTVNATIGAATPTPEPVSLAILGAGLVGLGVLRRKRKAS